MADETKKEKAGATAPATPSKVEGTQSDAVKENAEVEKLKAEIAEKDQVIESLKESNDTGSEENEKLKGEIVSKDQEIAFLNENLTELKSESDSLESENASLKSENENLKSQLKEASQSQAELKGDKKFIVVDSFRDKDKEGLVYKIDDDVSYFDETRLINLVKRGLVIQL